MALTKIMGQNFRAFVGGAAVNEATNCQVTIQGNVEDGSTCDSVSGYNEETMTSKQWSVQVDNVDASLANLRALHAAFARSGSAILNDLSIQAGNRQTIQVSCQYQGSGALA